MARSRYGESENRHGDDNYYYRSGYYDRDYGRDYGMSDQSDGEHMQGSHGYSRAGMGAGAAVMALAAFGLGWWVGARWHPESYERIGGMPRGDLRRRPTMDDYHGHVSASDPNAPAGTPPDPDQLTGSSRSGKSAEDSADTLRRAGEEAPRPHDTAAGSAGSTGSTTPKAH